MSGITFNIDAEGRAINKALRSILAKAKAAGVAEPLIFFESEGSVHVIEDRGYDGEASSGARQEFVRASAYLPTKHDVGAW